MADITKKTEQELTKMLLDSREKTRSLRFNSAGARTADVKAHKNLRKTIAQILTELRARRTQ